MWRSVIGIGLLATATASAASAATLQQTTHFVGADAKALFDLYVSGEGHSAVTGFPARFVSAAGEEVARASAGDEMFAFCFEPEMCGLHARVLHIQEAPGQYTLVLGWWAFGWVMATDEAHYTVEGRGAPDSTLVLTFKDTPAGAQIELVQANVPDYEVRLENPDGSVEIGPLSQIVNTHWSTLYWDAYRRHLAGE